jgi:hypothetical protein
MSKLSVLHRVVAICIVGVFVVGSCAIAVASIAAAADPSGSDPSHPTVGSNDEGRGFAEFEANSDKLARFAEKDDYDANPDKLARFVEQFDGLSQ